MCMKIRFVTAIALAVEQLRSSSFSAFNVTKKLREQVNAGDIEFSDKSPESVDGQTTFRVDHEEVRSVLNELYNLKVVSGLQRRDNGRYLEYVPCTSSPVTPVIPSPYLNIVTTSSPVPTPLPPDALLRQKIQDYLKGRRGQRVTMKEVQSRFKGVDKKCNQYGALIASMGIPVNTGGTPSAWFVTI